jgi:hypothetical protein
MTIEQFTTYVKHQIKTEQDNEKKKTYQSVNTFLFECGATKKSARTFLTTKIARTSQKAHHTHDEEKSTALYTEVQTYLHLRAVLDGVISVSLPPSVPDGQLSLWSEETIQDCDYPHQEGV